MSSAQRGAQPTFATPITPASAGGAAGQQSKAKPRYLLASGGRDKQVLLYDSENNYDAFMSLDHHASTITSLHFNEYATVEDSRRQSGNPNYVMNVDLLSSSADKNLVSKNLDLKRFQIFQNDLATAGEDPDNQLFKLGKTQICKDKILSLDVASAAQYMITGHDKSLCLWKLPTLEKVWEKRVATMEKEANTRATGQAGTNQVQLRVMIDDYASVVVSSSTSKRVTIYEAATGQPLCRAQPGQITTAMCFSTNMKHLITTSDNGLIFIWRLPEKIAQCLGKIKNEAHKLEAAIERTPSIIEEVEERDELGESHGAGDKPTADGGMVAEVEVADIKNKTGGSTRVTKEAADKDFDFDVPESLQPTERDNTIVKRRKEEVADVLADIGKAANFIDKIAAAETPPTNLLKRSSKVLAINADDQAVEDDMENEEDDEAQEVFKKADYPFKSKQ